MFNEQIKKEYVDQLNYDEASIRKINYLFERIEPLEKFFGTDVSNLNSINYPKYICDMINPKKFSYFESLYNSLMSYKEYCYRKGHVDLIEYHTNNTDLIDMYKEQGHIHKWLYECFENHIKYQSQVFYTPDFLIDYLEEFYETLSSYRFTYEEKHSVKSWEIVVLYLCLLYFGLPKDKLTLIKKSDIVFNKNNSKAAIKFENNVYSITGKTVDLLYKIAIAEYVQCLPRGKSVYSLKNVDYRIAPLHAIYLLAYDTDDTEELVVKRGKKLYNIYSKDCTKENLGMEPTTVKNIIFQGEMYRLAIFFLKLSQNGLSLNSSKDILDLYEKFIGKQPKNFSLKMEIVSSFKLHLNYLINYENKEELIQDA